MKTVSLLIYLLSFTFNTFGENIQIDTLQQQKSIPYNYKSLIIPTALLGYGIASLKSNALKDINREINDEFRHHVRQKKTIDDYTQYAPSLAVYGLNAVGIKGKHKFVDRTIILGTAYIVMGATVGIIKRNANVKRPDSSFNNSFPSGHTATVFMGAEFLYQEYKDVSIWYGISGYMVASGTGFLRMYNNRHWLGDVAGGAGIGILSAKFAYWVHPFIKKAVFKNKEEINGLVMPYYNGSEYGLGLSMRF